MTCPRTGIRRSVSQSNRSYTTRGTRDENVNSTFGRTSALLPAWIRRASEVQTISVFAEVRLAAIRGSGATKSSEMRGRDEIFDKPDRDAINRLRLRKFAQLQKWLLTRARLSGYAFITLRSSHFSRVHRRTIFRPIRLLSRAIQCPLNAVTCGLVWKCADARLKIIEWEA